MRIMRYWLFMICDVLDKELGSGWVRAENAEAAISLVGHPDTAVTELPDATGFPIEARGSIYWERRAPGMLQ